MMGLFGKIAGNNNNENDMNTVTTFINIIDTIIYAIFVFQKRYIIFSIIEVIYIIEFFIK